MHPWPGPAQMGVMVMKHQNPREYIGAEAHVVAQGLPHFPAMSPASPLSIRCHLPFQFNAVTQVVIHVHHNHYLHEVRKT